MNFTPLEYAEWNNDSAIRNLQNNISWIAKWAKNVKRKCAASFRKYRRTFLGTEALPFVVAFPMIATTSHFAYSSSARARNRENHSPKSLRWQFQITLIEWLSFPRHGAKSWTQNYVNFVLFARFLFVCVSKKIKKKWIERAGTGDNDCINSFLLFSTTAADEFVLVCLLPNGSSWISFTSMRNCVLIWAWQTSVQRLNSAGLCH